uniref:Beta/gamma crystallin 'Greek key' domain-containing protein n=1 Tax=Oreochromis aureus TaxID=47969 RepID=A0A668SV92_OREAU
VSSFKDTHTLLGSMISLKVEGGWWVLYERNNFTGYQYVIGPGEYNNYGSWMGFNDCVRSCRIIRNVSLWPYKLMLYERLNFVGQSLELTESIKSVQDKWLRQEVQSCKVLEGTWNLYSLPASAETYMKSFSSSIQITAPQTPDNSQRNYQKVKPLPHFNYHR